MQHPWTLVLAEVGRQLLAARSGITWGGCWSPQGADFLGEQHDGIWYAWSEQLHSSPRPILGSGARGWPPLVGQGFSVLSQVTLSCHSNSVSPVRGPGTVIVDGSPISTQLEVLTSPHSQSSPSGLVSRVSCLIASSLSIIINFFCSPCQGLLFFYSSCLLQELE